MYQVATAQGVPVAVLDRQQGITNVRIFGCPYDISFEMFRFDRSPEFFDRLPAKKGTATHADALGYQPLSTNPECKLNWLDPTSI